MRTRLSSDLMMRQTMVSRKILIEVILKRMRKALIWSSKASSTIPKMDEAKMHFNVMNKKSKTWKRQQGLNSSKICTMMIKCAPN